MDTKNFDVVGLGSCYVDTNLSDFPFNETGIPVETELIGSTYDVTLGGSAVNFCVLLQELGLKTAFIGMAGTDPNGDLLADLLEKRGIQPAIIRRDDVLTNIGFNMTNPDGKHIMLVGGTASSALRPEAVMPKLQEIVPQTKMLYLGGYFKLKSLIPVLEDVATFAQQQGADIVLDHGRIPEGTSAETLATLRKLVLKATCYFPSHAEFCQLWDVQSIEEGLQLLQQKAPHVKTVVKDGQNGAFYADNSVVKHTKAVKVEKVLNVTGAGDSFNAGVMAALASNRSLDDAVAFGCQVAAAKISNTELPAL